ncbi:MAG: proline--tRNA ligase [Patescibacteria group bacterium]
MRYSKSFIKTQKETPSDSDSINASYLERASFVEKQMAGVYALLPLGFKVYQKIENIIREEMNTIDSQEILMNVLSPKELWEETGRWQEMKDILYAFKDARDKELALSPTHEEQLTSIVRHKIHSYKDLPQYLYQIQTKFRNEPRAKSGLLRGREFLMKDLYSFHQDEEDLNQFYEIVKKAYLKIFARLEMPVKIVEASGGPFGKEYSHEFQVLAPAGEDTVFYCTKCDFAQNKEIAKVEEGDNCPKCDGKIAKDNGIEVGNIFKLKTKYSKSMGAVFVDENGQEKDIVMGSYGIGITRCLASLVEMFFDVSKNKMVWPKEVAPFDVYLIDLEGSQGEKVYDGLVKAGIGVLFDDREVSAGVKFSDADLLGAPYRLVLSAKTLEDKKIEFKKRDQEESNLVDIDKIIDIFDNDEK